MAKRNTSGKQLISASRGSSSLTTPGALLDDVQGLIHQARTATAQAVNSALVLLYWQIGQRIRIEVLKEKRAGYGDEIVSTLSNKLTAEFGNGFSQPNMSRMTRFAEVFPDQQIVVTLSRQLGWSHFVEITPSRATCSAISTLKCAASSAGASAPFGPRSRACSSSAPPCRGSRPSWPGGSFKFCPKKTA